MTTLYALPVPLRPMLPGFYRIIATCQRVAVKAGLLGNACWGGGPEAGAGPAKGVGGGGDGEAALTHPPCAPAPPTEDEGDVGPPPHQSRQQVQLVLAAYLQSVLASCRRFKVGGNPELCYVTCPAKVKHAPSCLASGIHLLQLQTWSQVPSMNLPCTGRSFLHLSYLSHLPVLSPAFSHDCIHVGWSSGCLP